MLSASRTQPELKHVLINIYSCQGRGDLLVVDWGRQECEGPGMSEPNGRDIVQNVTYSYYRTVYFVSYPSSMKLNWIIIREQIRVKYAAIQFH